MLELLLAAGFAAGLFLGGVLGVVRDPAISPGGRGPWESTLASLPVPQAGPPFEVEVLYLCTKSIPPVCRGVPQFP